VKAPGGLSGCTFDAAGDRRVQFQTFLGDLVAAFNAVAELTFIETFESRIDLRDLPPATFYGRLGHGLALKSIHPR